MTENLRLPRISRVSRGLKAPTLHSRTVYPCARCTISCATLTEDSNAVQDGKKKQWGRLGWATGEKQRKGWECKELMPAQRPWQLGGQVLEGALTGRRDDGGGAGAGASPAGVCRSVSGCALPLSSCGLCSFSTAVGNLRLSKDW